MVVANVSLEVCEISISRLEFFLIATLQAGEAVQILHGDKNNNSLSDG
jgi:hypothetical protein